MFSTLTRAKLWIRALHRAAFPKQVLLLGLKVNMNWLGSACWKGWDHGCVLRLRKKLLGFLYEYCSQKCCGKFLSFYCPSETASWRGRTFCCSDQDLSGNQTLFCVLHSFVFAKDFLPFMIANCRAAGASRRHQIQPCRAPETNFLAS